MKKLLNIFVFFVFCTPIFLTGCPAAGLVSPITSVAIMWLEGEAHKYYPYDEDIVYRATKRALTDMGCEITEDVKCIDGYHLTAGEYDKFKINIERAKQDITQLSVRINFMGDKPYAELLYSKVDDQLSTVRFGEDGKPMLAP